MKTIPTSQGKLALVDDEDYDLVSQYKWTYQKRGPARPGGATRNGGYVVRHTSTVDGKRKIVRLHRMILGELPEGKYPDHINGDKLDNRRCNLRFATQSENNANAVIRSDNTSGVKGVHFHKRKMKFCASISYAGKRFYLGAFKTIDEAARAYAKAAIEIYGEFARLS